MVVVYDHFQGVQKWLIRIHLVEHKSPESSKAAPPPPPKKYSSKPVPLYIMYQAFARVTFHSNSRQWPEYMRQYCHGIYVCANTKFAIIVKICIML